MELPVMSSSVQSSITQFGSGREVPVLKSVGFALKRSYDALSGSSLAIKLIPAVGVVAFAAWGLAPLIRLVRVIFFHRSDSSWKKSSSHYITISYIQPLLIWCGVTLICRALDPVLLPTEASQAVMQRLLNFARSLSTVLAFAYCLSSLIQQAQKFFVEANDTSDARTMGFSFAGKAIYSAVWVAAVSLFMELLGFSTQKWLTAGGLGTVLLTLAGREIFTNFLSSVMIHATRPFVLNEWIQTKIEGYEVSGTVEHVGWWSPTIIRGEDREAVHIPNHKFTVNVVRNLSQKTHWRIKTHLAISHLDVNKINSIVADMRKVLAKNPQVEQQRLHRRVFLENINPENQALMILISCFVKTSHFEEYLCVKEAILLDLLRVISHHRARLATPIRTVQKIYSDADLESSPLTDSVFSRSRAPADRPFLLIEPPAYKINGDDKAKTSTRISNVRANEEKDSKVEANNSTTESKGSTTSTPNIKKDSKVEANNSTTESKGSTTSTPNIKKEEKVASASGSGSLTIKPAITAAVDHKDQNIEPSFATQAKPELPPHQLKDKKVDRIKEMPKSEELQDESTAAAAAASSGSGKAENLASSQKPEIKSRPPLEDNIVLGVALEGSKRTLPIEEDTLPAAGPAEPKELAAQRNTSGPLPGVKDKKEG
ncbi:hypothetical protein SAY86_029309 [Trapa natans]|uniref:Mechanosensitive ion channel protein 2, chloroplastic-like n=1 Tax=Trapa natans TaxID=22666 RepID=A0AAN7RH81_TRANT|nr:hypothetical protein SAY86_029309 [Trapa natans]